MMVVGAGSNVNWGGGRGGRVRHFFQAQYGK